MPDIFFSSENLDTYLKELAKEFRKINGKTVPAEVILVGGAAILANYGFRDKTYDVDAIIHATIQFEEKYETTLNDSNVTDILSAIEKKKKQ